MKKGKSINALDLLKEKRDLIESIGKKISDNNENPFLKRADNADVNHGKEPDIEREKMDALKMEREKLFGKWHVIEHKINDEDYLKLFVRTRFRDFELKDGIYEAEYEFKDRVCLKKMEVRGSLIQKEVEPAEEIPYYYRVCLTITYQVKDAGILEVILESGYLYYRIGEEIPVIKDLIADGKPSLIDMHYLESNLILEEKAEGDYKILARVI